MSKPYLCSSHVVPPAQRVGKPAATCVEDETVDSSGRFCCVLHRELPVRLLSSALPAVGIALSAAVGLLSFTSCRSALITRCRSALVRSSYHQPPILSTSAVDCVSSFYRCFAQRASVTFATFLFRGLLVRASWHSMSRPPWHSMASSASLHASA